MRAPEFWQGLLSLELSPTKARAVLSQLGPDCCTLQQLLDSDAISQSDKQIAQAGNTGIIPAGINWIGCDEQEFPENLRSADPPVAISFRGTLLPEDTLAVAIVGTRKASVYGKAVAKKISMELASAGVTIVSGGAHGVDSAAHEGALEVGGRTIAVMGCGVDVPYPKLNRELFDRVIQNGAIVSQFSLGSAPDWWRFPTRNDTIVGLSRAVVVIEAPEKSGALTTASSAAEHGRHMFVTPANIDSLSHRGSFRLINEGATLLYSPDQIFEALGVKKRIGKAEKAELTEGQRSILALLSSEPEIPDVIAEKLNLQAGPLLGELTLLEVLGYVSKTSGGYIKN